MLPRPETAGHPRKWFPRIARWRTRRTVDCRYDGHGADPFRCDGDSMPDLVDRLADEVASRLRGLLSASLLVLWSVLFSRSRILRHYGVKRGDSSEEA